METGGEPTRFLTMTLHIHVKAATFFLVKRNLVIAPFIWNPTRHVILLDDFDLSLPKEIVVESRNDCIAVSCDNAEIRLGSTGSCDLLEPVGVNFLVDGEAAPFSQKYSAVLDVATTISIAVASQQAILKRHSDGEYHFEYVHSSSNRIQ